MTHTIQSPATIVLIFPMDAEVGWYQYTAQGHGEPTAPIIVRARHKICAQPDPSVSRPNLDGIHTSWDWYQPHPRVTRTPPPCWS